MQTHVLCPSQSKNMQVGFFCMLVTFFPVFIMEKQKKKKKIAKVLTSCENGLVIELSMIFIFFFQS